ncbi:MAG: IS21 family transposase, partial [Methylococcales bacterium]|nr:IS21 family transposase [Methylococcales bacterium]
IIKNTDHYRDKGQRIQQLEQDIQELLSKGADSSQALCALLKQTSPKIYKDQLLGVKQIINKWHKQYGSIGDEVLERILRRSQLTATGFRACLEAWQYHLEQTASATTTDTIVATPSTKLARYSALKGQPTGQGGRHVIH